MTPKPRFGCDVDGVCCDWEAQARRLLLETFGIDLPLSEHWNSIQRAIPQLEWDWLWDANGGLHQLFSDAETYLGALAAIDELSMYVDVVIITQVPEHAIYDRVRWLHEHTVPCTELHVAMHPKSSIHPHCDFYLEDSSDNITDLVTSTDATILVIDRLWNSEVQESTRIIRCQVWNDVLAMVRRHIL